MRNETNATTPAPRISDMAGTTRGVQRAGIVALEQKDAMQKKMTPWGGPKYHENEKRGGSRNPCAYCGKEIKKSAKPVMMGVTDGGARFYNPKDYKKEYAANPGGEMGLHPLGPDCARKLKAEQPELFA
jgi:hypothetical protein